MPLKIHPETGIHFQIMTIASNSKVLHWQTLPVVGNGPTDSAYEPKSIARVCKTERRTICYVSIWSARTSPKRRQSDHYVDDGLDGQPDGWTGIDFDGRAGQVDFHSILTPFILPDLRSVVETCVRAETMNKLANVVMALKRYQASLGRVPDRHSYLLPEFLDRLSIDPWTAAEMSVRLSSDVYEIRSAGENRVLEPQSMDDDSTSTKRERVRQIIPLLALRVHMLRASISTNA